MTLASETEIPFAKPSTTIVVLRDAKPTPELLMVKRRAGDAFGDSYTFPGGIVDADEVCAHAFGIGTSAREADTLLGVASNGLSYFCAGIRELFEETGILLARDSTGAWAPCRPKTDSLRTQVDSGALPWAEFLQQQKQQMAFDALHYFAHWETPFSLPKRWTTRFFAAELPEGQEACHDGSETTDSCWWSARDTLQRGASGEIKLPYPTVKTLESLSQFDSIKAIFDWTITQQKAGITMTRPATVPRDAQP